MKADPYDHYAVLTNFPLDLATDKGQTSENDIKHKRYYSLQDVIEHHAKRAYGSLAQVAHNLLRWVSLVMKPDKPHFAKKLRKRFVFYPGKILYRSRQIILRIVQHGYEEVMKLRETWGFQSEKISPHLSSA